MTHNTERGLKYEEQWRQFKSRAIYKPHVKLMNVSSLVYPSLDQYGGTGTLIAAICHILFMYLTNLFIKGHENYIPG